MSDLPVHLSIAGTRFAGGVTPEPRALIEWAKADGIRGVVLDGTLATMRARELDRSARRDLAALLRRLGLTLGGIDLWIPPRHFAEGAFVDRATAAVLGTTELAGELSDLLGQSRGSTTVSLELPGELHQDTVRMLKADLQARVVDHRVGAVPGGPTGVGVDPAAVLMAGSDPADVMMRLAGREPSGRLSDAGSVGRCAVGAGRLDVRGYAMASAAAGAGRVILDLRGLEDANAARESALRAWERA